MKFGRLRPIMRDKKGLALGDLYPAIMTLVLVGILLGIGMIVLSKFMDNVSNTQANLSVNETIAALGDFSGWFGIIVVVICAAIILGLVLRAFGTTSRRAV